MRPTKQGGEEYDKKQNLKYNWTYIGQKLMEHMTITFNSPNIHAKCHGIWLMFSISAARPTKQGGAEYDQKQDVEEYLKIKAPDTEGVNDDFKSD